MLKYTSHGYNGYVFDADMKRHDFIGYRADCINNYAVDYLHNRPKDKPFFMFISQIEPHQQNDRDIYEGPDGSKRRFADYKAPGDLPPGKGDWEKNYPDYLGQCHSLDQNVGRLIDTLIDQGVWDNTILFYTSDHGSHFRTHEGEYKRTCHDSAIHIPMIAIGGPFTGHGVEDGMVSLMDIPRTLLDLADIEIPDTFRGHSLVKLVEQKQEWPQKEVFIQISESQVGRCIRTPRYTYSVRALASGWFASRADEYYEEYLYDNEADPHQKNNLVAHPEYASLRAQLRDTLKKRMAEAGEKVPEIIAEPFPR